MSISQHGRHLHRKDSIVWPDQIDGCFLGRRTQRSRQSFRDQPRHHRSVHANHETVPPVRQGASHGSRSTRHPLSDSDTSDTIYVTLPLHLVLAVQIRFPQIRIDVRQIGAVEERAVQPYQRATVKQLSSDAAESGTSSRGPEGGYVYRGRAGPGHA